MIVNRIWETNELMNAIRRGSNSTVKNLISSDNRLSSMNWNGGYSYLREAMSYERWDIVSILLDKVTKVNGEHDRISSSALHYAVIENKREVVKRLLQVGADVEFIDMHDMTALHHAVILEHESIVELLLDYGADTNHVKDTMFHFTPLQHACKAREERILRAFLDHGADVNYIFTYPDTLICPRRSTPLHVTVIHGNLASAKLLLERGANVNHTNDANETALHLACRDNNQDIVKLLVENGADVDAKARNDATPLHIAVKNGYLELVRYLVSHGADVKKKLLLAVEERHLEVLECLLEQNGCTTDENNRQAFQRALLKNGLRGEMFKCFLKHGFELTPNDIGHIAFEAVDAGYFHVIENLLDYASQQSCLEQLLNSRDSSGDTLLHKATKLRNHDIVRLLISKKVSVQALDESKLRAIEYAVRNDDERIVKTFISEGHSAREYPLLLHKVIDQKNGNAGHMLELILRHGADPNEIRDGKTVLHVICETLTKNHVELADLLLRYKADVRAKTNDGLTPLHLAAARSDGLTLIRTLLKYKPDIETRDNNGMTPLLTAAVKSKYEILEILLDVGCCINPVNDKNLNALDLGRNYKNYQRRNPPLGMLEEERQKFFQEAEQTYDILVKHACKLIVAGFPVSEQCQSHVTENYDKYVKQCENELDVMKNDAVNSHVTMYDVFVCNVKKVVKYTREETARTSLEMIDLKGKYPIYGSILNLVTEKYIMREYVVNKAKNAINVLTGYGLPDPCTETIFENLYTDELCNLLTATSIHINSGKR